MNKKTFIIAGVLVVVAVTLFLLPQFVFKTPEQNTTQQEIDTTTNTTTAFPLSETEIASLADQATKEFSFAFAKSREWREDSIFIAALTKYTKDIGSDLGKNTYVFFSPSLADFYWTLEIDQAKNDSGENDFQRIIYYREDYFLPPNAVAVPMQYWELAYVDALRIADQLGGKEIRAVYPEYDVNILLSAQEDRYLIWDIEYLVNNRSVFSIAVNAFDGTTS